MDRRKNAVTMKGNPVTLIGAEPRVGSKAPDFTLVASNLSAVRLSDSRGRRRLLLIVPSLDTPTCATEAVKFSQRLADLSDGFLVYIISRDLPFAQTRFCGSQGIENLTVLSGYKDEGFGQAFGVLIEGLELYARAIFIIDENDNITYVQVVKEIADEPDYDDVIRALQS